MPREPTPELASLAPKRKLVHCAHWRPPGLGRHGSRHANLARCPLHRYLRSLGPWAIVGVLGTGVPRHACLRPTAWLNQRTRTTHLHQQTLKTLARGQALRGGRHKTSSGAASPGWLPRSGDIYARCTSRGSHDVSHDDQGQAGASGCRVPISPLVPSRQAQPWSPKESSKGFHIGAIRPRPPGRQDGGHRGAHGSVTTRAFCRRRLLLSG